MEEERDECKIGLGLSIGISSSHRHHDHKLHILFPPRPRSPKEEEEEHHQQQEQQQEQSKRRLVDSDHEDDRGGGGGGGGCARKKLRLSQEQATLLEDTFREHNTLGSFQKQELAAKLNLRPRQVEIWFQNRRARNKWKQTEVDFQLLKKWCETLNEENRRLKKELQELKLIKQPEGSTLYLDLPKVASGAAMGLCPSCDGPSTTADSSKKSTSGDSSVAC